ARALQYLEMPRDRRLAHGKRFGQVHHRYFARCEPRQDCPPRGIGQRRERCVEMLRVRHLTIKLYNVSVIYMGSAGLSTEKCRISRCLIDTGIKDGAEVLAPYFDGFRTAVLRSSPAMIR